jgi:hypothetical protein
MACLQCWLGWLKRSETCPTCRVAVKKESLARAVFQKDSKPPTLSQFDDDNADDSDEELEICNAITILLHSKYQNMDTIALQNSTVIYNLRAMVGLLPFQRGIFTCAQLALSP